jgi:hypothetical protein
MPESQVVNMALKCFFDQMPSEEKQRVVALSKNHY